MNPKTKCSRMFSAVSEEWLEYKKIQLKQSSYVRYHNILHLYLVPEFGNKDVITISRSQIQSYCHQLLSSGGIKKNGLSPKTINCIISVLKSVFLYSSREIGLKAPDISDISAKQLQKPTKVLSKTEQERLSLYLCQNISPCHLDVLICFAFRWEKYKEIAKTLYSFPQIPKRIQTRRPPPRRATHQHSRAVLLI